MPAYSLPRLVMGKSRTYINFYALLRSGGQKHYKATFGLNRIHNLKDREDRGRDLVKKIKWWLEQGYYFEDFEEHKVILELRAQVPEVEKINLIDAIIEVRNEKILSTDRRASKRVHVSHSNIFIGFLRSRGYDEMAVDEFNVQKAQEYVRYWYKDLKCTTNNSYNTKRTYINMYFKKFLKLEYINKNPWQAIDTKRKNKAKHLGFSLGQMPYLAKALKEKNKWMWVCSQLAFWGLVRQEEMSRIRFHMFNIKEWTLDLTEDETKNHKDDIITLPVFLRDDFKKVGFFDQPSNYLIISNTMEPGTVQIDEKKLNKWHQRVFNKLAEEKKIEKIPGQSFQSWRRTGMDYFSHRLTPRLLKDHNRHDSFETTERYLPNRSKIDEVAQMVNDVF